MNIDVTMIIKVAVAFAWVFMVLQVLNAIRQVLGAKAADLPQDLNLADREAVKAAAGKLTGSDMTQSRMRALLATWANTGNRSDVVQLSQVQSARGESQSRSALFLALLLLLVGAMQAGEFQKLAGIGLGFVGVMYFVSLFVLGKIDAAIERGLIAKLPGQIEGSTLTADALAEKLGGAIDKAFRNYIPQPDRLATAITGSVETTIKGAAAGFESSLKNATAAMESTLKTVTTTLDSTLKNAAGAIDASQKKTLEAQDALAVKLGGQQKDATAAIEASLKTVIASVDSTLKNAAGVIDASQKKSLEAQDALAAKWATQQKDSATAVDSSLKSVTAALDLTLKNAAGVIDASQKKSLETQEALAAKWATQQKDAATAMDSSLKSVTAALDSTLKNAAGAIDASQKKSLDAQDSLAVKWAGLQKEAYATLDGTKKALDAFVTQLTTGFGGTSEKMQAALTAHAGQVSQSTQLLASQLEKIQTIAKEIEKLFFVQQAVDNTIKAVTTTEEFKNTLTGLKLHLEKSDNLLREVTKPRTIRLVETSPELKT